MGRQCVMHLLADSCVNASAREAGSAAKVAAVHKTAKYHGLDRMYIFQLLEVESLGPFDDEGCSFLVDLDCL